MPKAPQPIMPTGQLALGGVASFDTLAATIAAFRDHAALAAALIAQLDGLIDRCAAIPTAEWARWVAAQALYNSLRRGTVPSPIAPHVWLWRTDLRTVQVDAFPLLIRVRDAYARLDQSSRRIAARRFGTIHNGGQDYTPVWRVGGWPTQALRDLDAKAATAKLDIVPLMTTNGALWAAHGITEQSPEKRRFSGRRKAVGVA